MEAYVRLLGRLHLNSFDITATPNLPSFEESRSQSDIHLRWAQGHIMTSLYVYFRSFE